MRPLIQELETAHTPDSLVAQLAGGAGVVLLRGEGTASPQSRYSFVTARPFLTLRSHGSRCEIAGSPSGAPRQQFGNPWRVLDGLMARYELLDELDLPFPLGGCFGYWGYDLKNFVEARLPRRAVNDLELPDCQVGFYDSLVAFDHQLGKTWTISTGLDADGSRTEARARLQFEHWQELLSAEPILASDAPGPRSPGREKETISTLSREEFIARVEQAQRYIRAGDIYQVNLAQRLSAPCATSGREFFLRLGAVSPALFWRTWIATIFKSRRRHRNCFCASAVRTS